MDPAESSNIVDVAATMSEQDNAAKPPPPTSVAERRMARRKALIQEHIAVTERAMAEREYNEQDRGALAEVVAGLRRRVEELDAEQDVEAWAAAHPPKKMPEANVAYYRGVEAREVGDIDALPLPEEMVEDMRKAMVEIKENAARILREYEANGYVEHFEADDIGLTPNYFNLMTLRF